MALTDNQLACLLMAAPFLTLCLVWTIGCTVLALTGDEQ